LTVGRFAMAYRRAVARCGMHEEAAVLGGLGEEEGRPPPPLSGRLVGPHGPRRLTGPKARKEFF
jgi:hypothetical protein